MRPEKIGFGPVTDAAAQNGLTGLVLETVFMGDALRCLVRVAPGQVAVVKQPHRTGLPAPLPGETVQLHWAVADTLLI